MNQILFVENLKSQADVEALSIALDQVRLDYSISLGSESVSVRGDNDAVYMARQAISQAGYTVK